MIDIAGAPVSFGLFDLGDAEGGVLPGPDELCAVLARHDYSGVDLGPLGFLGRGAEFRDRLDRHGLALAGGWVDLPFSDDALFAAALETLDATLDAFAWAPAAGRAPLPTLADSGSGVLRHAGSGWEPTLDSESWRALVRNVGVAAERVRDHGLEPTFHHHAGTWIEAPQDVDRLLDETDVGLTLDTGHLLLAGGDPICALDRWGERINHVHLKDARLDILRSVIDDGGTLRDVWTRGAFVPFGFGDLDLAGFMGRLVASGYDGWLVVEQDRVPHPDDDPGIAERDHSINRDALRKWVP
ncbi:TIM barrel protein [Sinomonas sp.]|uniref:TIM barrel protein n=1 Tax=Sinomonas sp. TaxID=1914986 RepID=UPI002FDFAB51